MNDSDDSMVIVKWIRAWRLKVTPPHLRDGHESIVRVERSTESSAFPFFIHEATRYVYDDFTGCYVNPGVADAIGTTYTTFHKSRNGITDDVAVKRKEKFGSNQIPFNRRSVIELLAAEFFTAFYFYQFIMYSVWFWFSYLFMASVSMTIVILGAVVSVYIQWNNEKTIAVLTEYETTVEVKRNGQFVELNSNLLVPGDIVRLTKTHWNLPCDICLLAGSCILNESGLTGESMPVQKIAAANDGSKEVFDTEGSGVRHSLYAGTTVLQLNPDADGNVEGIVTSTGTWTSKGQLVASILFPEQLRFKYEEEMEVVVLLLLMFAIVCFVLVIHFQNETGSKTNWVTKWAYGIFSPLLPVALKVGQIRSSKRLEEQHIFCLSPRHIAITGKITVFCFDKTGTLTKEGMDFRGGACAEKNQLTALKQAPNAETSSDKSQSFLPENIVECMATCHAVARFGKDQYVGNEVEVKMFTASGWDLLSAADKDAGNNMNPLMTESSSSTKDDDVSHAVKNSQKVRSPDGQTILSIVRKFDFDHGRQTMSVITEDTKGNRHAILKGSFEKVEALCDPASVPPLYRKTAKDYALNGGYVLGLAKKSVANDASVNLETLHRDTVETAGSFELLGLLVFRNEPKSDSRGAIEQLRDGVVRPVMITGDNAQCGQYICRSCALVDMNARILLAEMKRGAPADQLDSIEWSFMGVDDGPTYSTTEVVTMSAKPDFLAANTDVSSPEGPIELAVTGNVTLQLLESSNQFTALLPHVRVFARMSPDNKSFVIRKFRSLGYIVGMCGDGGNDCGALKAAHAGLALSEAEASIVSPFTSSSKSPQSVVDLLKEGRASLATSFSNYKFLITYGQLFSIVKLASFYYGVLMSLLGYFFIDGLAITTLCYTMTLSRPVEKLSKLRPTASLLGPITVASSLGMSVISMICLVCGLLMMANSTDYEAWPSEYSAGNLWWELSDNYEATVLYAIMFPFLVMSAAIFSLGYEFRMPLHFNGHLVINVVVLMGITIFIILSDDNYLTDLFHMASKDFSTVSPVWQNAYAQEGLEAPPAMSLEFRLKLFFMTSGFITLAWLWQWLVLDGFIGDMIRAKYPSVKRAAYRL